MSKNEPIYSETFTQAWESSLELGSFPPEEIPLDIQVYVTSRLEEIKQWQPQR